MTVGEFKRWLLSLPPEWNGKDLAYVGIDDSEQRVSQLVIAEVEHGTVVIISKEGSLWSTFETKRS